jgi:VIT1/CCC1 family predicted Fe2+/Mn2+ transporter
MKLGILLFIIGLVLSTYLANLKFKKKVLKQIGIVVGILIALYGLIQLVQPDDYIKFTKTTISQEVK